LNKKFFWAIFLKSCGRLMGNDSNPIRLLHHLLQR
jgi:hypothetical protein